MAAITDDQLGPMSSESRRPYHKELYKTVKHEYETKRVFLEPDDIFNASAFAPLVDVKAVTPGQDLYHNYGQAHGLCLSVKPDAGTPPSLVDIYQELYDDSGHYIPNNGYLKKWADQGVTLLNTMLMVGAYRANSHRDIGWEKSTDAAINVLNQQDRSTVFILWERPAQAKKAMLNNPRHLIPEAPHSSPSSVSRGLLGSRPFSKTNTFLAEYDLTPVDWQIENV